MYGHSEPSINGNPQNTAQGAERSRGIRGRRAEIVGRPAAAIIAPTSRTRFAEHAAQSRDRLREMWRPRREIGSRDLQGRGGPARSASRRARRCRASGCEESVAAAVEAGLRIASRGGRGAEDVGGGHGAVEEDVAGDPGSHRGGRVGDARREI
jgi:hypothetical protein